MLRIGVTSEILEDYQFTDNDPPDINHDLVSHGYLTTIVNSLERLGFEVHWLGDIHALLSQRTNLAEKCNYIFNLAEGSKTRNRASAVPLLLEFLDIPYLGSDAFVQALSLNKYHVTLFAQDLGVNCPETFLVYDPGELRNTHIANFPVIAKPVHEGSSIGIFESNIVNSTEELYPLVKRLKESYRQPILVQQFISGYEITVPTVGNKTPAFCEPMTITMDDEPHLGDKIYSSDIKHLHDHRVGHAPCSLLPSGTLTQLRGVCWDIFRKLDIRDYCRFDFRLDEDGRYFLIDVNAMAELGTKSSFARSFQSSGIEYDEMILFILQRSFERWGIQW